MLGIPPAKLHFSSIRVRLKSLKFALLFVTGCIASILIIELTIDGLEAWEKYQHTKTLMAADAAGNRLVTAVYYLRREQPSVNAGFKGIPQPRTTCVDGSLTIARPRRKI